jgi:hypothetical protein
MDDDDDCRPVGSVVRAFRAGGRGLIPGWTNTRDLKMTEEKVLPFTSVNS